MQNMKRTHWNTSFFGVFFTILDLIWPKFCPKNKRNYTFLTDIRWNLLVYTINLNNLWCNPAVLKKRLVKPLRNCFFDPNLHRKRGHNGPRARYKNIFCVRNNKSRSSAFRKFLFYQNIRCFDWVISLFLSWVMFSVKRVSFPAKTSVKHKPFINSFQFYLLYYKCWLKLLFSHRIIDILYNLNKYM